MKARIVVVLVLVVALVPLHVRLAQASVAPVVVADSFFTALNAGNDEAAIATFTPDAVATLLRGETYRGPDSILRMVQLMEHAGRHYEIVYAHMVRDTVTVVVEVSDHGIHWGEDTIVLQVRGGKVQTFHQKAFRLRLGS